MNKNPSRQELERLSYDQLKALAAELAEEDDHHIKKIRHYFIDELWKRVKERPIKAGEVGEGQLVNVKVGEDQILVAKVKGKIYAMDNRCPHRNFPLHRGQLDGFTLTCANHGAQFDIRTGACIKHSNDLFPCPTFEAEVRQDGTVECGLKRD